MDKAKIIQELMADEGKKLTVYHDSLGKPTVGIGHLITDKDVLEVGDTISEGHCQRKYIEDIDNAIDDCHKLYKDFDKYPPEAQSALVNMMFNLGLSQMMTFHGFNATIETGNWAMVVDFLRNNFHKWYLQVGDRAKRIEAKFRQAIRQ